LGQKISLLFNNNNDDDDDDGGDDDIIIITSLQSICEVAWMLTRRPMCEDADFVSKFLYM